jgi:hypothetical protein
MKIRARFGLRLVLLLGFSAVSFHPVPARAEQRFDVIPQSWITGCGRTFNGEGEARGETLILPSVPGAPASQATQVASKLLTPDNRIPINPLCYRPPAGIQKAMVGGRKAVISVRRGTRDGKQTNSRENERSQQLTITADEHTVTAIRSLNWSQFRVLQDDFANWLVAQNQPKYLFDRFKKPIDGFNDLEGELRQFWRKTLATGAFKGFVTSHQREYFGESLERKPDATRGDTSNEAGNPQPGADGVKMGAIPLLPGVRLAVHWGGTAVYGYNVTSTATLELTRQTSVGVSYVEVDGDENETRLSQLSPFQIAAVPSDRASQEWPNNLANAIEKVMPYGKTADFLDRIVPVYNDFDLHNSEVFPKAPRKLFLLIPATYPKSDSGSDLASSTHEASSNQRLSAGEGIGKSLYRRVSIWGADQDLTNLEKHNFNIENPAHKCLVFGNQTWIDVEVPVSINGQLLWIGRNTSIGTLLARNAPSLTLPPNHDAARAPQFEFLRKYETTNGGAINLKGPLVFRFWTPPVQEFLSIELFPSDSFLFHP